MTEAVILAGGLGTRLQSRVPNLPKAMAPVAGQPFLTYLLQLLEANGLARVVLAVGYRSQAIESYFGTRCGNVQLAYSREDEPLGTGGALLRALSQVESQFAFVLNGDTFLQVDYQGMAARLEREPAARLAIALRRVSDAERYGTAVVVNGRVQAFNSRGARGGGLINAGTYVADREVFRDYPLPAKFSFEQFIEERASELLPIAFECDGAFIDIGVSEAFEQAQSLLPSWSVARSLRPANQVIE